MPQSMSEVNYTGQLKITHGKCKQTCIKRAKFENLAWSLSIYWEVSQTADIAVKLTSRGTPGLLMYYEA